MDAHCANVRAATLAREECLKTLHEAIRQKDFAVIGQLRLHQDDSRDDVLQQAKTLAPAVDAVAVTDCPYGVLHMSGLAVSAMLLQEGIDPVMHFSSRDRNRIALKSELLGAAALGVTSMLLKRGDPLPDDVQPTTKQVFDTGAKRMLATARQLSDFQVANGRPELFLGTIATVFDAKDAWKPTELAGKISAGARFLQTQICLDTDLLRRYMERLAAANLTWQSHVIVSIPVLTSASMAQWLYENLRGSVMPERIVREFENARDPEAFGIDLCANTIKALREIPGVSGVNLSTTGDPASVVAAVNQAIDQAAATRPSSSGGT